MDKRRRYEERFRRVRVRREVAEKLEEACKGRSLPDCVSELLERALAGVGPTDCRATQLKPLNVFLVDCSGRKAIIPGGALADFAKKLGVTVEVEGDLQAPSKRGKAGSGG